jgi:integrase
MPQAWSIARLAAIPRSKGISMSVGNVERYRAGNGWRYRVRWSLVDGSRRSKSFKLRKDADVWLRRVEADRMRGVAHDPRAGRETFDSYSERWMKNRVGLAPRTVELYESELRLHIAPRFGERALNSITVENVRDWRADIERAVSATTAAKCYRLMRTIMGTAEEDGLIPRNPCRVKGASVEKAPERPLLTLEQVTAVAETIAPRYRLLVLLAAFSGLRRGELLALQRRHLDELRSEVRVEAQAQRVVGRGRVVRETKSAASVRTVAIPRSIMRALMEYAQEHSGPEPDAWLFVEPSGSPVREASLYKAWKEATAECGLPGVRLHDLRHFAGTSAAQAGATTRELQQRLGHATARASMLYQHAAADRDQELAERIGAGYTEHVTGRSAEIRSLGA